MPPKAKKPAPVPPLDDIDLGSALPPGPGQPAPATTTKRGRGRPRSAAPPPPRKYKVRKDKGVKRKKEPPPLPPAPYIDINNILLTGPDSIINNNSDTALRDIKNTKMSQKELKFMELYFTGDYTQIKAMKSAGYEAANDSYLNLLAKKIISKYESLTQDHRIIARAMGAGEVAVLNSLISLMKSANERIRLDATINMAKILGMTKEQLEGAGGVTIIFEAPDQPGQAPPLALPGGPEAPKPVIYEQPVKMLQITK